MSAQTCGVISFLLVVAVIASATYIAAMLAGSRADKRLADVDPNEPPRSWFEAELHPASCPCTGCREYHAAAAQMLGHRAELPAYEPRSA